MFIYQRVIQHCPLQHPEQSPPQLVVDLDLSHSCSPPCATVAIRGEATAVGVVGLNTAWSSTSGRARCHCLFKQGEVPTFWKSWKLESCEKLSQLLRSCTMLRGRLNPP